MKKNWNFYDVQNCNGYISVSVLFWIKLQVPDKVHMVPDPSTLYLELDSNFRVAGSLKAIPDYGKFIFSKDVFRKLPGCVKRFLLLSTKKLTENPRRNFCGSLRRFSPDINCEKIVFPISVESTCRMKSCLFTETKIRV